MNDRSQISSPVLVDLEFVGDGPGADTGRRPVLYRPSARIRSPIVERRPDAPAPDRDRPGVEMPPIRTFIGPLVWVIVPGLPVLARVGWQAALVVAVAALVIREVRLWASRSTLSFGDGFLGYAGMNRWPPGVQEDDDVHWNWSAAGPAPPGQHASG